MAGPKSMVHLNGRDRRPNDASLVRQSGRIVSIAKAKEMWPVKARALFVLAGMALSSTAALSASPTKCGQQVANAYEKLQATQVFQFEDRFTAEKWGEGSRWMAFDIPRAANRMDTRILRAVIKRSQRIAIGARAW